MTISQTYCITTACSAYELRPDAPGCPADWRWRRAEWRLRSGSRRGERQDDNWVRRAVKAQRCARKGKTNKFPDIAQAQKLLWPDHWKLAELQARILANQSNCAISSATGVPESVITAFEALFFDVRRRLHAQDWVICCLLGPKMWAPWKPEDATFAWLALGYLYGPSIVDALVHGADRDDLMESGLPAYWNASSRLPKEIQLLLISRTSFDYGTKNTLHPNHFVELGLCEERPRFSPPPKDFSLVLTGDYSWGETEIQTLADELDWTRPAKVPDLSISAV